MKDFELRYVQLIQKIMHEGELREGRNGNTRALFGESFSFDMSDSPYFPLLLGRKIFFKGILGELAAFLRGPKSIADFEKFGCNYWKLWGKEDGSINVDYGNLWTDWNGYNQLEKLLTTLKNNPTDRRMIISSWKPDTMDQLDLPCCHYSYQWFVRKGEYLDMIWTQRSCDTMIGLPSDIVLAATLNLLIANEVGLKPGRIKMDLGDTHIYEEHFSSIDQYINNVVHGNKARPRYYISVATDLLTFDPYHLGILGYNPTEVIKFELKG